MSHDAFREKLLDLAYGELSPRAAREAEEHAEGCADCRAELGRIRETRRVMAALPHEPAPERGERILLAAAREAAERRPDRRRLPAWIFGAAVVTASVVAVGAVSWRIASMRPGPLQREDPRALLGESYAGAGAKEREPTVEPASPKAETMEAGPAPAPPPERKAARPQAQTREAPAVEAPRAAAVERFSPPPPAEAAQEEAAADLGLAPAPGRPAPSSVSAADAETLRPPPSLDAPAAPARAPAPAAVRSPAAAPSRADGPPAGGTKGFASPPEERAAARLDAGRSAAGPSTAEGARSRFTALRDEGGLRGEIRTFPGCEGESWRRVETDPEGRIVRYVREGRIDGRRLRIEHVYGPGGALEEVTVRDLDRSGAALDPAALGVRAPARAEEAGIDAPPRCGW